MTHEEAVSTLAPERYLLEEMSGPERETFEEHYFSCVECADDVRTGGVMRDGVHAGLMNEQSVHTVHDMTASAAWRRKNVGARRWYQSPAIPWAAAAALAVVAGYQALVPAPGRSIGQPMALAPVTLRPASRGQEPKVSLARDTAVVTLAIEMGSTVAGTELSYAIRTAAGAGLVSGTVRAPQSGAPLLLLVPSLQIPAPGHYVLIVADGEYPFEVVAQ
jgi:hypothetical protein